MLERTIAAAAERERALASSIGAEPHADHEATWPQLLEQLDVHLRAFQACTDRADREAQATDAALAASEEALHHWLGAATMNRQSLADWAAHGV
jgi:hypothetical protein